MEQVAFPRTPSALWNSAWGGQPRGEAWQHHETKCVMCGADVKKGAPASVANGRRFDKDFNFKIETKFKGDAVCGDCLSLWQNFWMQKGSKSYAVHGKGVFWLSKNTDIAAFILSPPEEAYVAVFNSRQQAQIVWRTPVAIPSHVLQVRIDDDLVLIDTEKVKRGVEAWQLACRILVAVGKPKGAPYICSYNMGSTANGMRHPVNADAVAKHSEEGKKAIDELQELTMGEWWALSGCRAINMQDQDNWPKRRKITQEDTIKKAKETEKEPS